MNLLTGMLLILGLMILIFLGPEWVAGLLRERPGLKKAGTQL